MHLGSGYLLINFHFLCALHIKETNRALFNRAWTVEWIFALEVGAHPIRLKVKPNFVCVDTAQLNCACAANCICTFNVKSGVFRCDFRLEVKCGEFVCHRILTFPEFLATALDINRVDYLFFPHTSGQVVKWCNVVGTINWSNCRLINWNVQL